MLHLAYLLVKNIIKITSQQVGASLTVPTHVDTVSINKGETVLLSSRIYEQLFASSQPWLWLPEGNTPERCLAKLIVGKKHVGHSGNWAVSSAGGFVWLVNSGIAIEGTAMNQACRTMWNRNRLSLSGFQNCWNSSSKVAAVRVLVRRLASTARGPRDTQTAWL